MRAGSGPRCHDGDDRWDDDRSRRPNDRRCRARAGARGGRLEAGRARSGARPTLSPSTRPISRPAVPKTKVLNIVFRVVLVIGALGVLRLDPRVDVRGPRFRRDRRRDQVARGRRLDRPPRDVGDLDRLAGSPDGFAPAGAARSPRGRGLPRSGRGDVGRPGPERSPVPAQDVHRLGPPPPMPRSPSPPAACSASGSNSCSPSSRRWDCSCPTPRSRAR